MMLVCNQQKLFNFFNKSAFHCNITNCVTGEPGIHQQFGSAHNSIAATVAQHKWSPMWHVICSLN